MTSVAHLVDGGREDILRRVRARLPDARMHGLATHALDELVRSLHGASTSLPAFPVATNVAALTAALRELSAHVLDAIESQVSARELRSIAEWFWLVSERVHAEANRRLVAMLDALDDHVILLDPKSNILFLNQATEESAVRNWGRPRAELIGGNILDGAQSQEFKQYVHGLVGRAGQGEAVAEEFLLPVPEGAVWHEHRFRPVRDPDGEVELVAICSRKIHARKQAEGRLLLLSKIGLLAESNELDGMLGRAAGLAIPELADWSVFELVQDGEVQRSTVVHPSASRVGEAESQLTAARAARPRRLDCIEPGGSIFRVGHAEDGALSAIDPDLYALLARHQANSAIVIPFLVMGAPIALATFVFGSESGRRHTSADLDIADEIARRAAQIVENARLHSEVAQALTYRERVMGILGHDLRNPVSAVLSLSGTLAQRVDVPERTREGLRHIWKSAERMEQMIATLLDFTQLRFRGLPSLALEAFDLETLIRTVIDELRAAHPRREIAVESRGELRGRWDVSRMGQVISNLVANGLTHGTQDAPVHVRASSDDHRVFVAVSNRGPTIPADAQNKLFEPFWQVPSSSATRSRGLGLGLFIAQQIVRAHDGDIVVRSHDEQTTFTVLLPR